ncbi:ABC transporter permease [Propioniciclava soli]|uniref:ABC transporter permease n=1 Tax=Propioniciclava soli TaxID=2775081 RepID=A0ABZ3C8X6_9ACTN
MNAHNIGTVIAFEVRRTLAKPSFWIATLSVPLLMALLFGLSFFSGASAAQSSLESDAEPVTFTYTDASGIVDPSVAAGLGGTAAADPEAAAAAVREGRSALHIDIPADPVAEGVHVVGEDLGLMESGRWTSVARALLTQSAVARIDEPRLTSVLDGFTVTSELWAGGAPAPGWGAAIAPALFLVLLFMAVVMLGQQMLNITVEEKENRVTEMILTTVHPSTLIIGKVIGVVLVGIVQGLVLLVPLLAMALVPGLTSLVGAPAAEMADAAAAGQAAVDLPRVLMGAALFLASFVLFAGILVAIGAVMPSAKDAGSAFGSVIIAMFLPLYALPLVLQTPESVFSRVLTYFPLTAPVTMLTRNAVGSIELWQAGLVLAVIVLCAVLALSLGVRLFREGSIAYDQRLSWKDIVRATRSKATNPAA